MHLVVSLIVGLITGVFVTLPLGPIAVYVVQRALQGEIKKGISVGLGSVIVDVFYCMLITMGLMSLLSPYLQNIIVQLLLSSFVIAYGVKMLLVDRKKQKAADDGEREASRFVKQRQLLEKKRFNLLLGAMMAIANPSIIVSYTAIIGFITANGMLADSLLDKIIFALANGAGSLLCFIGLSVFVKNRRHVLPANFAQRAATVAAIAIIGFGVYFTFVVVQRLGEFV
jgi:threonine/homoserine/homoserine lactone efflux protein